MSVKIEKLAGLKRKLTVTVPADKVTNSYNKRVKHYAKDAKLPGFRQGKAPDDVVANRFENSIKQDVASDLINDSFQQAVVDNELRVAGQPDIHLKEVHKTKPLEYEAHFEIYPDIELTLLQDCTFDRLVTEVMDQDIDQMVDKIRGQHATWENVERAAAKGDQIVIDFAGTVDGEAFEGGKAEDFTLELGSGRMIPGFEDQLMAVTPGQELDINVTFPAEYPAKELAGKAAVFAIKVKAVKEAKLPEVNEDFVTKQLHIEGGVDQLRAEVAKSMQREASQMLEAKLKNQALDKLLELNPIELPESLVEHEIKQLQNMTRQQMVAYRQMPEKDAAKVDLPRDPYVEQAKRRVSLGLLLSELIKENKIEVSDVKLREKVTKLSESYQNPEQIVAYYYNNKQALAEVEAAVLEEEAVAKLLDSATVSDKTISYAEAIKLSEATGEEK